MIRYFKNSKRRILLPILLILTFLLASCGTETEVVSKDSSNIESTTQSPTETPTPDPTSTPTNTPTAEPTPKLTPEPTPEPVSGDMAVHFLDVGQGLSIFVQSGGQNLIYDGGDRDTSRFVVSYLQQQNVKTIDYLISSHYDADHLNGLIGCLNAFDVENVICADYVHDSQTYQSFINTVNQKGLTPQHPAVGTEFAFGTGKFTILAPSSIDSGDSNNNSVAIKLENGQNSFIFTGDAESSSESAMCLSGINLDCDVLSLGHHGSASSTSWEFLQNTVPEFAVISCGSGNQYGHPHAETMEKLQDMGILVFRSDKQGTVIALSDGENISWNQAPCNDYTPGEDNDTPPQPSSGTSSSSSQIVSTPELTPEPTQAPTDNVGEMVWITKTGSKYHNKPDCGNSNPDTSQQISRSDAEARGYDACKKCY